MFPIPPLSAVSVLTEDGGGCKVWSVKPAVDILASSSIRWQRQLVKHEKLRLAGLEADPLFE